MDIMGAELEAIGADTDACTVFSVCLIEERGVGIARFELEVVAVGAAVGADTVGALMPGCLR